MKIENSSFKKLIGKWQTEGRILQTENNPEMKIMGTDSYETILDGFFILHKAHVLMGNEKSQTHELIKWNEEGNYAVMEYHNNKGASGKMTGNLKNGKFSIDGDGLRFKGQFSNDDKQLTGTWERQLESEEWVAFLEIKLTK